MQATTDQSVTTGLKEAVDLLLPALEQFMRFEDQDLAASNYAQWSAALNQPLPQQGIGAEATLRILKEIVIPHGLRIGAPGFAGWVTTMPTVVPTVAAFSASIAGAQRWWLQSYNFLENLALEWLKQLLSLSPSYQGTFSSGGSVANLIALGAARQWACEQRGIDASRDGLGALQKPRLYASNQVHHVVHRAAGVLGLGRRALVQLPTDDFFRLDVSRLREQLRRDKADGCTPIAVIASAGTVNTGAIDPLHEIVQVCREEQVWLHVDGAYGGFGILDPEIAPLFNGFSEADSIVVDPHKWLAVPLGCGATFVRDPGLLGRAFTLEPAGYLEGATRRVETIGSQFDDLGYTFHNFNIEQSARSRGVTVWAALAEIGAEGMRARVTRHNGFARHLAARVQASPVLELLAPVTLSICCFRYVPPELRERDGKTRLLNDLNREILARLHSEHHHVPSGTELNGEFAIRPCYINPRTTLADVDGLVEAVERIGAQIWREQHSQGNTA
ncbi:pyridoxal phosphate-dependent decarboxylase family protein [Thermoflexus sp.]|uniref:pyridoxal phosphate-dependent decarboxylase family protein n=1 Tax=Thermoflexus sp. TaxID=1969742 RepID=UPI0035E42EE6